MSAGGSCSALDDTKATLGHRTDREDVVDGMASRSSFPVKHPAHGCSSPLNLTPNFFAVSYNKASCTCP